MYKENFKKAVALILSASVAACMGTGVLAADNSEDEYVTREYAISEFVQSIGRNNLKGNENVLKRFTDTDDIDEQYRQMFNSSFTDEDCGKEIQALLKEHPEIDPETKETTKVIQKMYSLNELTNKFKSIDIPEIFEKDGFKDLRYITMLYRMGK